MAVRRCAWSVLVLAATACGGGTTLEGDAPDGEGSEAVSEDGGGPDGEADSAADSEGGADVVDVGERPPALRLAYADSCPCIPAPCCPEVTLSFEPGDAVPWFLFCGDAVACEPPPVGWERRRADGTWERIVSPGESGSAGWQCAPESFTNPWMSSVPYPPAGTVRAVALFDRECGPGPLCTEPCGRPYEVLSNEVLIPEGGP